MGCIDPSGDAAVHPSRLRMPRRTSLALHLRGEWGRHRRNTDTGLHEEESYCPRALIVRLLCTSLTPFTPCAAETAVGIWLASGTEPPSVITLPLATTTTLPESRPLTRTRALRTCFASRRLALRVSFALGAEPTVANPMLAVSLVCAYAAAVPNTTHAPITDLMRLEDTQRWGNRSASR